MSHTVHSGLYWKEGKPALMIDMYFLRFHEVFCFSWSVLLQNNLSNRVILVSFPTVLKYSMCWLSQLNESEFIYKLLCSDFFNFFVPALFCLKHTTLFVEGKTWTVWFNTIKNSLLKICFQYMWNPSFFSCLCKESFSFS